MHDFNFFESCLSKGRQPSASAAPYVRIIVLLLIALAAWPLFNLGHSLSLMHEASSLEAEVTTDEKYPLLEQAKVLEHYVAQLQNQRTALQGTDAMIQDSEWLNEPFLFSFFSAVPKDLQWKELDILSEKEIQLSGSAANKPSIAEFERNLRETGRFEALYVESISNEDGTYGFTMNFKQKGGGTDAGN